jgi:hypothetical protein
MKMLEAIQVFIKVITIPDGIEWEIKEYDGLEHIAEKHRTWD